MFPSYCSVKLKIPHLSNYSTFVFVTVSIQKFLKLLAVMNIFLLLSKLVRLLCNSSHRFLCLFQLKTLLIFHSKGHRFRLGYIRNSRRGKFYLYTASHIQKATRLQTQALFLCIVSLHESYSMKCAEA